MAKLIFVKTGSNSKTNDVIKKIRSLKNGYNVKLKF